MTFIHNAGLGELLDRLSIVCRKITESWAECRLRDQFESEAAAIINEVVALQHGKPADGVQLYNGFMLATTNAALWERENGLRGLRPVPNPPAWDPDKEAAQLAHAIAALNDRRRTLIATLSGHDADPKIYR